MLVAADIRLFSVKVPAYVLIAEVRARYAGLILGGIDEDNFPKLSFNDLRRQAVEARPSAGKHFLANTGLLGP